LCWAASDAENGVCYLRSLASTTVTVVGNEGGKLVFKSVGSKTTLYTYDLGTQHFLGKVTPSGFTPTSFTYSANHHRVYVGDSSGKIHAYSEALIEASSPFATVFLSVNGLATAGKYLVAQDSSGAWATHYVFDSNGIQTDKRDWNAYSSQYNWSAAESRLYYFRDDTGPNDVMYEVIDQSSGKITSNGETPYHGDYEITGPIRSNAAGTRVAIGSGNLFVSPDLTWGGALGSSFNDAMWLSSGEILTATSVGSQTRLQRFNISRSRFEDQTVDGKFLVLATRASSYYLVLQQSSRIEIRSYVPSDDVDGDGVSNTLDKFPMDKAASLDSDNDGHPDSWNPGYSASDSCTGLTLDAYPHDASCHAAAQGDGVSCSPALHAPATLPERILSDDSGTLYLYSSSYPYIYRWSQASASYIAPLPVGEASLSGTARPISIAYSSAHNRLYLGYNSGHVTRISLSGDSTETAFVTLAQAAKSLVAAGNYLLAQDESGAWATHYIFDSTGVMKHSKDWNYFSNYYFWSPSQSRAYFFRDDTSPNDLMFEVVNQGTGQISSSGESPYHGNYNIAGPIRVSSDGSRIVLGSGNLYETSGLTVVGTLPLTPKDMQWLASGALITISPNGADTRVATFNTSLANTANQSISGVPVSLQKAANGLIVVTKLNGTLSFTTITP